MVPPVAGASAVCGERAAAALRRRLQASNGLPDLGRYMATAGESGAEHAASIFHEHGFVVIPDALSAGLVDALLRGCEEEADTILALDPARLGNRGSGRYSLGEAQRTGHLLHREEWASLVDLETVAPALDRIFGSEGYVCAGAGGDFVLGGVERYQNLHADLLAEGCYNREDAPVVTINFTVSPLTWENGPTRIIPGSHLPWKRRCRLDGRLDPPPEDAEDPVWKLWTFCPLPAGCAIVRDNRTWHGGTPNLTGKTRFLPNCEFAARWWCRGRTSALDRNPWLWATPCMPRAIYDRLSDRGRELCELVVADGAEASVGVKESFGCDYVDGSMLRLLREAPSDALCQMRQQLLRLDAGTPSAGDAAAVEEARYANPALPGSVFFGLHRGWCDHVFFDVNGSFWRRAPGAGAGRGRWELSQSQGAAAGTAVSLCLEWEGGCIESLHSEDGGCTFRGASAEGLARLIACADDAPTGPDPGQPAARGATQLAAWGSCRIACTSRGRRRHWLRGPCAARTTMARLPRALLCGAAFGLVAAGARGVPAVRAALRPTASDRVAPRHCAASRLTILASGGMRLGARARHGGVVASRLSGASF